MFPVFPTSLKLHALKKSFIEKRSGRSGGPSLPYAHEKMNSISRAANSPGTAFYERKLPWGEKIARLQPPAPGNVRMRCLCAGPRGGACGRGRCLPARLRCRAPAACGGRAQRRAPPPSAPCRPAPCASSPLKRRCPRRSNSDRRRSLLRCPCRAPRRALYR